MCLIRNFPSRVKMKTHDMSRDGILLSVSGRYGSEDFADPLELEMVPVGQGQEPVVHG